MGGHSKRSCTSYETAIPQPDYTASGNPVPDASGEYFLAGTYNGKLCYKRNDNAFYLWWYPTTTRWLISTGLGTLLPGAWYRINASPEGNYTHGGTYSGSITVTAG